MGAAEPAAAGLPRQTLRTPERKAARLAALRLRRIPPTEQALARDRGSPDAGSGHRLELERARAAQADRAQARARGWPRRFPVGGPLDGAGASCRTDRPAGQ